MADTKMFPIGENFDFNGMVEEIQQTYQAKGFDVSAMQMGQGVSITFAKDDDGIKKFVGLGLAVTANISINNNNLVINFTDAEWMGKLIALGAGLLLSALCVGIALLFTGGYGVVKQLDLPKMIGKDIQMIANGGATGGQPWRS